jgi:predicted nucleotidyltransferase
MVFSQSAVSGNADENTVFKKIVYIANMLTREDIENKLRQMKPQLADKFHVSRIGYFGSFANDKQNENSDLDILVEFSEPIGWEFFTLERFLEQSFGIPIDLVTKNALKERLKDSILNQVSYV